LGRNYKKYIEDQCFSVQLVNKIITFAISWTIYINFYQRLILSARPGRPKIDKSINAQS